MKNRMMTIPLAIAVLMTLTGCGGAVKYPSYYTLHVPPPPDPPLAEGVHASLVVHEFREPSYLRRGIVYKTSPEQIGFYNYDRWAVDPREFVTNAIEDRLSASGKFARVTLYDGHSDIDFVLSGNLEKLDEIDYDGGVKVEVAISAQMVRLSTGETVWTSSVSEFGTVTKRDVPAVVAEMNRTMDRAIQKLLTPAPAPATK